MKEKAQGSFRFLLLQALPTIQPGVGGRDIILEA